MKRTIFLSFTSLIFICLAAVGTAFGQKACEFSIIGTWKVPGADGGNPVLYRFGPDATVTIFAGSASNQKTDLREIAKATYTLDNPKTPKTLLLSAAKKGGGLPGGATSMDIAGYDDTSVTVVRSGSPTRWIKVEPSRYFIVFAGSTAEFYDTSGPTFPMMIVMIENRFMSDVKAHAAPFDFPRIQAITAG